MKRIFLYALGMLVSIPVLSQHRLGGRVVDGTGKGVPSATVRVLGADSVFVSGNLSDSTGVFSVPGIREGAYILSVSYVGYAPKFVRFDMPRTDYVLPSVTLEADNVMLDGVTVTASSFIRKKDHLLVIPDKQQVRHASTGYDLLWNLMIPGIDVDKRSGKVKTFGGEVSLYIDGRKVDYREVQSLRPKDVERVEYYDVPTGKYANDVAAVNYITRKYKTGGYVSLDGRQTIGYLNGDYNIVAKLAHENTSFTLFGGYSMERYGGQRNNGYETMEFPGNTVRRSSSALDGKIRANNQYVQLNVENRNEKRALLGKISFVRNDEPENFSRGRLEYLEMPGLQYDSEERTAQRGLMPNVDLYGNFTLKDNQYLEVTLRGSYTNNDYSYHYAENDYSVLTRTDEDLYDLFGNVNYGIRFKRDNSLAAQLYHFQKISMSDYVGTTDAWQHLWTGETIFFVEYSQQFGKRLTLKAAPGFSLLQYKLHGESRIRQFSPRLRTRMVCRLADNQQLQWTVNIGNTFPQISNMNNTTQTIDSLLVKRGNPALIPAKLYQTGLAYSLHVGRFNLQAMGGYFRGKDVTAMFYYTEGDRLVKSYSCDNKADIWQAQISMSYKMTDDLRFKLDGSWINLNCHGAVKEKFNSFSGQVQADYYLKDFAFSLYGKTKEKQIDTDMIKATSPVRYGLNISYTRNSLRVEAGTENPFTKHNKWIYESGQRVYQFRNEITSRIYQQTAYVKLAYTFDFGKKTSRENNSVDRSINSAILKAR